LSTCRQPVATIEDEATGTVIFNCPRCGYLVKDNATTKVARYTRLVDDEELGFAIEKGPGRATGPPG
jgi:uncharacterized C2H2 Zn-finger protein